MSARRLPKILTPSRRPIVIRLVLIGIAQSAVALLAAWLVFHVLASGEFTQKALNTLSALFPLAAIAYWLRIQERTQGERLGQDYVRKVRRRLIETHCLCGRQPVAQSRYGLNMVRMITDLNSLKNWISNGCARVITACLLLSGCLIGIGFVSPLFLAISGGGTLLILLVAVTLRRRLEVSIRTARKTRGRLSNAVSQTLLEAGGKDDDASAGLKVRKINRQGKKLAQQLELRQRHAARLRFTAEFISPLLLFGYCLSSTEPNPGELGALLMFGGIWVQSLRQILVAMDYWSSFVVGREKLERMLTRKRRKKTDRVQRLATINRKPQRPLQSGLLSVEKINGHSLQRTA